MSSNRWEQLIRWTARLWALASLLLLSAFVFGGAERSEIGPTGMQWIGLAFFPIGISVGMLISFWKDLWGGAITVFSLAGFYAWHLAASGRLNCGPWFIVFAAPGFLFLLAGLLHRKHAADRNGGRLAGDR